MSTIFICDGCGKQTEVKQTLWKPYDWFERTEHKGVEERTFHACSRPCIEKAAEKFGGTKVVLPI